MLAGLACVALIFAGCNQAVDDGNYVKLNDGENVTVATAVDAIKNQRGGTIFVKIGPVEGQGNNITSAGDAKTLADAIRNSPSTMVELDLSEAWNNPLDGGTAADDDLFGGNVADASPTNGPGARTLTAAKVGTVSTDFAGLKNLVSISLPFTVREIADNAFAGCENLETVKINFFFTKDVDKTNLYATEYMFDDKFLLRKIGEGAFSGCKSLSTFIVVSDPDNAEPEEEGFPVSLTSIGAGAFKDCYSLKGVRFLNTQNAGLEPHEVDGVAFVAHPVELVPTGDDVPLNYYWDFDGVSRNALTEFSSGIKLNAAIFAPDFDGTNGDLGAHQIAIAANAFENCKALEYVDFTNKLAVVTAMADETAISESAIANYAFSGCESLSVISVPVVGREAALMVDYPGYAPYELGTTNPGRNGTYNSADMTFVPIATFGEGSFQFTAIGNETLHDLFHFTDFAEPVATNSYHGPDAHNGTAHSDAAIDVVTEIGPRAFFGCENISEVLLPSKITGYYSGTPRTHTPGNPSKLGDGAFANTGVKYIWVHDNEAVYSILEDWLGSPDAQGVYQKPAPYWTGALVDEDPTDGDPTTIYAWFVTPFSGDLTYLPRADSQNPRTKVLGDALEAIKADAFYKNVDVEKILFPASMDDGADGIGTYAFANAENLEHAYTELDAADWADAADAWLTADGYTGAFTNTKVFRIHASDADSGSVSR